MVEGVVARQEVAGFGEEHDDEAHHHAHGSAVGFGRVDIGAVRAQCLAVGLHEQFDRLAHPFAERAGKFSLSLAAVEHGGEQRCRLAFAVGREGLGREQCTQGVHLG